MKIVLRSAMLLLVLFLMSSGYTMLYADQSTRQTQPPQELRTWAEVPHDAPQNAVPGAAGGQVSNENPSAYAEDRVSPDRQPEAYPPMMIENHSGPLMARQVCPADFYFNLVDVSIHDKMIVKFSEESKVRWQNNEPYSKAGANIKPLFDFLARHPEVQISRQSPRLPEDMLDFWETNGERNTGQDLANLNNYYVLKIAENPNPMGLIKEVTALSFVETAYYQPKSEPACTDLAPATPNYEVYQGYLGAAPSGVDAYFAGNYHPSGRGHSGAWTIDVEWDWTEDHEDWPTGRQVIDGDPGAVADHGDACSSIIGACNSGYGVTGISYNVMPNGVSWPIQGSWEGGFNRASGLLYQGESYFIEIHALGPTPIPDPGCACNCDQYKYVAVEYWQGAFDAIQNHTANGRIVYEAAGNGSMNLDNVTYASRFQRGFRDSGAILCGAGMSGATVSAECWTNYGSRLDLSGWGDNVEAAGYGNEFNPTGNRNQMYTYSFGGTSSATPIVTGSGNCLQGISQDKFGITITPANMRNYLSITGSAWTGTKDIGERPNLANAINWIEPDLAPSTRAGWYSSLTPRNVTGGTSGSCPITALNGNTGNTYFNISGHNYGYSPAPDAVGTDVYTRIFVDGDWLWWASFGRIGAAGDMWFNDLGPMNIRGGRHTAQWWIDPLDAFNEYSETNNWTYQQFVWSPYQFAAANSYQARTAPPLKVWGSPTYQNGDGFRGSATGRWWLGCAVLPQSGNDVDVYGYADAYSSTSGFDAAQVSSARGGGASDMVLVNGNISGIGYQPSRLFQAVRYSDTSTDDYLVEGDESSAPISTTPYSLSTSLGANEVMDIYEIYMVAGTQYFVGAVSLSGGLSLDLGIYGPGNAYYSFYDYTWMAYSTGANGNQYQVITPATTGWYAAVVMKDNFSNYGVSGGYTFKFEIPGLANLQPSPSQSGWDAPVVARNTADASASAAAFPATIQGNVTNYLNASVENTGTGVAAAGAIQKVTVDDALPFVTSTGFPMNPYNYSISNNVDVGPIRGGRHTLAMTADTLNTITESNEGDNVWSQQYVWSPYDLTQDVAVNRLTPPNQGVGAYPNSDGFSFTIPSNISSVVAVLPLSGADYDMYDYSDYVGTFSGFSSVLGTSTYGGSAVDYVIVPFRLGYAGFTHYGAVVNYNGATVNFNVEGDHTLDKISYTDTWTIPDPDTITVDGILNIYEFPLTAGVPYVFTMSMLSGNADLGLRLFRDSLTVQGRPMAIAIEDIASFGTDEVLNFTPSVSDWYDLVVEKTSSTSSTFDAVYNLAGGPKKPPMPVTNLVSQRWNAPLGIRLTWNHVTQDSSGNPLTGRRYVIYRNTSTDIVPLPADSIGGTTDSTYIDPNPFGASMNFYLVRVKAN